MVCEVIEGWMIEGWMIEERKIEGWMIEWVEIGKPEVG